MIDQLFVLALMWMHALAPGRDVDALAWAVAVNAHSPAEAAKFTVTITPGPQAVPTPLRDGNPEGKSGAKEAAE